MQQKFLTLGGLIALAVVGAGGIAIYHSAQDRSDTQRQIDELRNQLKQAGTAPAAGAGNEAAAGPATSHWTPTSLPAGGVAERQQAIHAVMAEGSRLLESKKAADAEIAIRLYTEGLERIDPDNVEFFLGLGQANLAAKHDAQAAHEFLLGLERDKRRPELWNGLATAYWNLKDFYHAKGAYEAAIQFDPTNVPAWTVMSWVYMGLKDKNKAERGFQILLLDPNTNRTDWKNGLTMARASNFQLDQIRSQFPLPDPQLFLTPPATTTAPK